MDRVRGSSAVMVESAVEGSQDAWSSGIEARCM